MDQKTCFKCGAERPLTDFYKHPQMPDGRVNKCKECNKRDVRNNRKKKVEYYRDYDKKRSKEEDRKRHLSENCKKMRERYPEKYKARTILGNAVRDGKMKRLPCEVCGSTDRIHGHHEDYNFPLTVRWLCAVHHKEVHSNG